MTWRMRSCRRARLFSIRIVIVTNGESTTLFRNIAQRGCTRHSRTPDAVDRVRSWMFSTVLLSLLILAFNFLLAAF